MKKTVWVGLFLLCTTILFAGTASALTVTWKNNMNATGSSCSPLTAKALVAGVEVSTQTSNTPLTYNNVQDMTLWVSVCDSIVLTTECTYVDKKKGTAITEPKTLTVYGASGTATINFSGITYTTSSGGIY